MSELGGVMDDGSPTQQVPAKTWSLAAWHRLEVRAEPAVACWAGCGMLT